MIFDVVALIIIAIAFINGYQKGILYMAFFFAGLFFGIFASLKLSTTTSMYLEQWFNIAPSWLPIISLVLTFLLVFILLRYVAHLLKKFLELLHLNFINQIVGGVLGAVLAFGVLSIGIWYLVESPLMKSTALTESNVYPYMAEFAPLFIDKVSNILPFMKGLLQDISELFDQHQEKITE